MKAQDVTTISEARPLDSSPLDGGGAPLPRSAADGRPGRRASVSARGGSVRSVERALEILMCLADGTHTGRPLEEVAARTGLPKSTTHRLLETLVQHRFVEPGPRPGEYRLGISAGLVGSAAIRLRRPKDEIHGLLRGAVGDLGETVGLAVLGGTTVISVDKVRSTRPLHWNAPVGATMPAHQSAAGKVCLAALTDAEVRRRYEDVPDLTPATPNSIRNIEDLMCQLDTVRRLNHAVDDEELEVGLRCVSVPVTGSSGRVLFALTMSAPTTRLDLTAVKPCLDVLRQTAAAMAPYADLEEASEPDYYETGRG